MRPSENIEKLIEKLRYKTSAETYDRILDNVLKSLAKSERQKTVLTMLRGRIMNTRITRRAAVLFCVALISVAAASVAVGPSLYRNVYYFLSALAGKRTQELVDLADPMSAVPGQILEAIDELEIGSKFTLLSLHADKNHALAITTDVVGDHDRQGPLVITFVKRDNVWSVTDIDLETKATAKDEIDRFLKMYPNAVEIPLSQFEN